jgi:uncharacterized protein (DUF4415 family)
MNDGSTEAWVDMLDEDEFEMKGHYDFSNGKRGALIPAPAGKTRISIFLDDDLLDWLADQMDAAGGGDYQLLINDAVRERMRRCQEPLEDTLRRVLREELARAA